MRFNSILLVAIILMQLLAFNLKVFQFGVTENDYILLYDKFNSVSWVIATLLILRLSINLKMIGISKQREYNTKVFKLLARLLFALSICPCINEFFGNPNKTLISNILWGVFFITWHVIAIIYAAAKLIQFYKERNNKML